MIPHNIQQKLEDRSFDCYQEALFDMSRKAHDHIYFRGASDLYFLLTEGAGEFDLNECLAGRELGDRRLPFTEGARWQFDILKPKMMAMELEMKHMRDQYVKDAKMMESQKLEIERLNVKSMAMEAEIQRLRDELEAIKYDHAETVELMMNGSERG